MGADGTNAPLPSRKRFSLFLGHPLVLFRTVMLCSAARFRNENKLAYVVCYTCGRTVTPVYANPFSHENPNALSCLFTVLEKKVLKL